MVAILIENAGGVFHICDHEEEDLKTTFIRKSIVNNLADEILHNTMIGGGYISHHFLHVSICFLKCTMTILELTIAYLDALEGT